MQHCPPAKVTLLGSDHSLCMRASASHSPHAPKLSFPRYNRVLPLLSLLRTCSVVSINLPRTPRCTPELKPSSATDHPHHTSPAPPANGDSVDHARLIRGVQQVCQEYQENVEPCGRADYQSLEGSVAFLHHRQLWHVRGRRHL